MKKQKGITLIALVITIIVLLILAGVSLRLVAGNEGILGRAESSVEKYNEATQKEDEDLKNMEDVIAKYDGTSTKKSLTSQIIAENYGDRVNYSVTVNGVELNDWKIFYNDKAKNEVIIILADCLPNTTELANKIGIEDMTEERRGEYTIYFKKNRTEVIEKLKDENNWKELLTNNLGAKNAKAKGTIDLKTWVASWNEKGYGMTYTAGNEESGYYLGNTIYPTDAYLDVQGNMGYSDKLYYPHQDHYNYGDGYWLSSLSAIGGNWGGGYFGDDYVMKVWYGGTVAGSSINDYGYWGIRPVIYLPASVIGEKVGDSWNIE